jgi:hypothetical protein
MSTLEIGCAPFTRRPNEHLQDICDKFSLPNEMFILKSRSFGDFEWNIKLEYEELYKNKQPEIKDYLIELYNLDCIRYASW